MQTKVLNAGCCVKNSVDDGAIKDIADVRGQKQRETAHKI